MSELAKEMGITRQRLHVIAKKKGIVGIKIAKNYTLLTDKDVEKLMKV